MSFWRPLHPLTATTVFPHTHKQGINNDNSDADKVLLEYGAS